MNAQTISRITELERELGFYEDQRMDVAAELARSELVLLRGYGRSDKPHHLDKFARNQRLYRYLLAKGYWVEPVFCNESATDIDYLKVST